MKAAFSSMRRLKSGLAISVGDMSDLTWLANTGLFKSRSPLISSSGCRKVVLAFDDVESLACPSDDPSLTQTLRLQEPSQCAIVCILRRVDDEGASGRVAIYMVYIAILYIYILTTTRGSISPIWCNDVMMRDDNKRDGAFYKKHSIFSQTKSNKFRNIFPYGSRRIIRIKSWPW